MKEVGSVIGGWGLGRRPGLAVHRVALALGVVAGAACAGSGTMVNGAAAAPAATPASTPASRLEEARRAGHQLVYVANQEPATVSILDGATGALLETVDLQRLGFSAKAKPHDTAVEPDGSYWYVSLIGDNLVVKLDRENRVAGRASVETPGLLALDPTSDLLYCTRTMSAVDPPKRAAIIDRRTMDVDEVEVFVGRPHAMAVDPRGRYAYVGSLADNQIATIDAGTREVTLSRIPGDSMRMIVELAVSPDGTRLVGTDQMQNEALVFDATDPTHLRQIAAIPVDPWPWHDAFTPDGREVWFGSQKGNSVTVLDATTWTIAGVVKGTGLAEPHGISISPDGERVFVSSHNLQGVYTPATPRPGGTGTVVVIDRARRSIVRIVETDRDPVGMSMTGDRGARSEK